jgi:hypothetical protein
LNSTAGSYGSYSLRIAQMTTEPFNAPKPFTAVGTLSALNWNFNGNLLWIPSAN